MMQAPSGSGLDSDVATEIRQQIAMLKQRVNAAGGELDRCRQEQEAFSVEYNTFKERNVQFEQFILQNGDSHPDSKKLKANKETMEKAIKQKVRLF